MQVSLIYFAIAALYVYLGVAHLTPPHANQNDGAGHGEVQGKEDKNNK